MFAEETPQKMCEVQFEKCSDQRDQSSSSAYGSAGDDEMFSGDHNPQVQMQKLWRFRMGESAICSWQIPFD